MSGKSQALSRCHKAAFKAQVAQAQTRRALEAAIAAHAPFLTPADHVEARAALAKRAAEISPNAQKG